MTLRALSLSLIAVAALSACNGNSQAGLDDSAGTPVATVGGKTITQGELDAWIKDELWRSQTEDGNATKVFSLRQRGLDRMIDQQLIDAEAAKRDVDADALLDAEAAKRVQVSDAEVKAFFDQHAGEWGDRTLETESAGIRSYLEREKGSEAAQAFVAELRAAAQVEMLLEQPRVAVAGQGHAKGPEDAVVKVIEFSDYECPFCRRAEPVVEQMLKGYAGKVRFEFRHFPLESIHPNARPAAEAAACADEQGQFWPYHALLFTGDGGATRGRTAARERREGRPRRDRFPELHRQRTGPHARRRGSGRRQGGGRQRYTCVLRERRAVLGRDPDRRIPARDRRRACERTAELSARRYALGVTADAREQCVALLGHPRGRLRLEVEAEQRLGVRRPQVEPPIVVADEQPVEVRDLARAGVLACDRLDDRRRVADVAVDLAARAVAPQRRDQLRERSLRRRERARSATKAAMPSSATSVSEKRK